MVAATMRNNVPDPQLLVSALPTRVENSMAKAGQETRKDASNEARRARQIQRFHPRLSEAVLSGNKIKTLNRQAYGYRDEEFFILKLLAWIPTLEEALTKLRAWLLICPRAAPQ